MAARGTPGWRARGRLCRRIFGRRAAQRTYASRSTRIRRGPGCIVVQELQEEAGACCLLCAQVAGSGATGGSKSLRVATQQLGTRETDCCSFAVRRISAPARSGDTEQLRRLFDSAAPDPKGHRGASAGAISHGPASRLYYPAPLHASTHSTGLSLVLSTRARSSCRR